MANYADGHQNELYNFFFFHSDCTNDSDCPNDGENYKCIKGICDCESGHVLDGEACVGRLSNWYSFITSKFISLKLFWLWKNKTGRQ